jgi:hypothetical protein
MKWRRICTRVEESPGGVAAFRAHSEMFSRRNLSGLLLFVLLLGLACTVAFTPIPKMQQRNLNTSRAEYTVFIRSPVFKQNPHESEAAVKFPFVSVSRSFSTGWSGCRVLGVPEELIS